MLFMGAVLGVCRALVGFLLNSTTVLFDTGQKKQAKVSKCYMHSIIVR